MIYDTLENYGKYFQPESPLFRAICFAAGFDPLNADGRYEIESENIFAIVSSYETTPASRTSFEIHRKYADIQIVIGGEEKIEVSPASDLKEAGDYDEAKDKATMESPKDSTGLVMRPGVFAVIYPNEAHRPNCDLHGKSQVRKIVLKVRMTRGHQ